MEELKISNVSGTPEYSVKQLFDDKEKKLVDIQTFTIEHKQDSIPLEKRQVLFGEHCGKTFKELLKETEWVNKFMQNYINVLQLRSYLCDNYIQISE